MKGRRENLSQRKRTGKRKRSSRSSGLRAGYKLVIVESPSKAKTLQKYFGEGFLVSASMGHVMDLPRKGLGVDLKTFQANYKVISSKWKVVRRLKELASKASEVFLATDPDREGEAIAYHLSKLLGLRSPKRLELREITPRGVREALASPRPIDLSLVTAQHTRRILDRIMGYTLSPLLWRALRRSALSAGRVQSVALKLLCKREREILNFTPKEFFTLELTFQLRVGEETREVKAILTKGDEPLRFEERDKELERTLREASWSLSYEEAEKEVLPPPPLITSTLQAECSKLGLSAGRTMKIAQELFEGVDLPDGRKGLITYHRTDSFRVSPAGVNLAKEILDFTFGEGWFTYRNYRAKRGAQDAHEAIRPTYPIPPESLKGKLSSNHVKVYQVVWNRFLSAFSPSFIYYYQELEFSPSLNLPEGWRVLYRGAKPVREGFAEIIGTPNLEILKKEPIPKDFLERAEIKLAKLTWKKGKTKPPPRYTQATLIKTLEKLGVGRPSTYATIIETLLRRNYAVMKGKTMVPTPLGMEVNDFLQRFFPDMINERFTAEMEEGLDEIESSEVEVAKQLSERYLSQFWEKLSSEIAKAKVQVRASDK